METRYNKKGDIYFNNVPCGKCPICVKAKLNAWLFRIDKELERSTFPLFVTLTYRTSELKWLVLQEVVDEETGEITTEKVYTSEPQPYSPTLVKKDMQDFIKRLRFHYDKYYKKLWKKQGFCPYPRPPSIKYYAVGEYGTKKGRPHYHMVLLNCHDQSLVHSTWGKGHTYSPNLRAGGASYVLKYLNKPKTYYANKIREFSLVSQGLGSNHDTPAMREFYARSDSGLFVRTADGYKLPIPKYFKERMLSDDRRKEVTLLLQKRIDQKNIDIFLKLKKRYKWMNEKKIMQIVDHIKFNIKFDERKSEIF